jgi:hypothetical protein
MTSQLELRREVFALLSWHMHHTDQSPLDTLNRLMAKATGQDLSQYPWKAFERMFSQQDLRGLAVQNKAAPHVSDAPPIVVEYEWKYALIDGQKRVNYYKRNGRTSPVRCLVIKIRKPIAGEDECISS